MKYKKMGCFKYGFVVFIAVVFFSAVATAENPASGENFVVFAKSTSSVKNHAPIKKAKVLRAAINALPGNAVEGSGSQSVSGAVVVNVSVDRESDKEFYLVVEMKYPDGRLEDDGYFATKHDLKNATSRVISGLIQKRRKEEREKERSAAEKAAREAEIAAKVAQAKIKYEEVSILEIPAGWYYRIYNIEGSNLYINIRGKKELVEECQLYRARADEPSVYHRQGDSPNTGFKYMKAEKRRPIRRKKCRQLSKENSAQ